MKLILSLVTLCAYIACSEPEKHEFQSETSRLMEIIINSLYSQKEVFLRELISNAADANDKLRFLAISNPEMLGEQAGEENPLYIRVSFNKDEQTITLLDNGIGMTKQDLISNLGTLAKSGTTNFLNQIKAGDMNLIGQFGVGFYSSFLVANKVQVYSSQWDSPSYLWESSAADQFTIQEVEPQPRGTKVVLHLKPDSLELTDEKVLEDLITRFSEFVNFPIQLEVDEKYTEEIPLDDDEIFKLESEEMSKPEEERKMDFPRTKSVEKTRKAFKHVNSNKAIWLRDKTELTESDYFNFYKSFTKSTDEPATYTHFKGEGEIDFTSLLYLPAKENWMQINQYYEKQTNIKLYVRRILIQDKFDDIVPRYLNFVQGIIDSDDLPLNVNRESIQQSKMLKSITKKLTKKILEMMQELSKDNEKYLKFWKIHQKQIKIGLTEDKKNEEKILKLCRFATSTNQTEYISFDTYLERNQNKTDVIYMMGGDSKKVIMESPLLQAFIQKGIDVLLLDQPIDEYVLSRVSTYNNTKLVNIAKGDADLLKKDVQERRRFKALKKLYAPLMTYLKEQRPQEFDKVELSERLVADPILIVSVQGADSAHLQKIYQTQANNIKVIEKPRQKILEINPDHPLIQRLLKGLNDNEDKDKLKEMANIMIDVGMVTSGFSIQNIQEYSKRIFTNLNRQVGLAADAEINKMEVDLTEVEQEELNQAQDAEANNNSDENKPEFDFNMEDIKFDDLDGLEQEGQNEQTIDDL